MLTIYTWCAECYGRNRYCPSRCFAHVAPDGRMGQFDVDCPDADKHAECPHCDEHGFIMLDDDDAQTEEELGRTGSPPDQKMILFLESMRTSTE